jgi:hypothetical protein
VAGQVAAAFKADGFEAMGYSIPDLRAWAFDRTRPVRAIGRTISAENEGRLADARALIDDVLSTLDGKAPEPAPAGSGDAPRNMDSKALAAIRLASPRH